MNRKCRAAILVFAFVTGLYGVACKAAEARSQSARFEVHVSLLPVARIRWLQQLDSVTVTEADAAAGYVDVTAGTHFELQANASYVVTFSRPQAWVSSATVRGLGSVVTLGADGGSFAAPMPRGAHVAQVLDYRFRLSDGVGPGTYPWPVGLSVTLLP